MTFWRRLLRIDEPRSDEVHDAIHDGDASKIAVAIKRNRRNLDQKDDFGRTPLAVAIEASREDVVMLLLANRLDLNARDDKGRTSLHLAIENKEKGISKLLLENGANADVSDQEGETPLHLAVGERELVQLLLSYNVDTNAKDKNGWTPLHNASYSSADVAALLLANNADVNAETNDGDTPLSLAAGRHNDIAELLRANNANVRIEDAIVSGWLEQTKEIIKRDPGLVSRSDRTGRTPLHYAAERGSVEIVKFLLAHKADVNVRNNSGMTPLHLAAYAEDASAGSSYKVVTELLLAKADINLQTDGGETPLHKAAAQNRIEIVELLLRNNADVTVRDRDSGTALNHAVNRNHREVAEILLQHGGTYVYNNGKDLDALQALANDLLSSDRSTRDGSIVVAREMAAGGNRRAVEALALAIRLKAGDPIMTLSKPGFGLRITRDKARSTITEIASRGAICKEARKVMGALEGLPPLRDSTEVNKFLDMIRSVGDETQVHEFQLVGTYWYALEALSQ